MILTLKLLLTPFLISAITLVNRRWGPRVGGWFMAFPMTSAPVSLILALQNGAPFAARAAVGSIAGIGSVCVFSLVYSLVCSWTGWALSVSAAIIAFLSATALWNQVNLELVPTFILVVALILGIYRLIPRRPSSDLPVRTPAWDLPARIVLATAFVVALTTLAGLAGPQLSGLLNPFPIFTILIASFTHHQQGSAAARELLSGLVSGTGAYASFFLVVGGLLPLLPIPIVYVLAAIAAVLVNGMSFRLTHREVAPSPGHLGS
ncbi:MAG TPA: hypothetical protein VMT46_02135 [Anaerolineaceae bacterium]|nr:hypothetical protein [Anaerolineaceae bacterium]